MDPGEPQKLFDVDEEAVPDLLNIENEYAKKYNDWRRKEELQRLKDKYGEQLDVMSEIEDNDGEEGDEEDDEESSSESESVEEDEFDDKFLKVYSALKADDPKVYDKEFKFFEGEQKEEGEISKAAKKEKNKKTKEEQASTMSLPEYHRKLVEERKGVTEEDEDQPTGPPTENGYYKELSNIRDEIKQIFGDTDDEEEDEDELFTVKETQQKVATPKNAKKPNEEKTKLLSTIWDDEKKLDEGEQFLKDYIVNQRYRDDEKTLLNEARKMANVDSHFGGFDRSMDKSESDDDFDHEEEEKDKKPKVEVAKYHFEEIDATTVKRFPRNISSIRDSIKPSTSKRAEARDRKRQEKESELKRLRRLKREEMEAKLAKLRDTAGIETPLDLKTLDLNVIVDDDAEFDPAKYDEKMKLLFGDEYYDDKKDDGKPKFDYVPEIDDDLYDEKTNIIPKLDEAGTSKKKKTKKDIKKNKDIMADDDIGVYEDLVGGDLATRFRYRMVEPNDFGLTDEEILLADEKELNNWVSLKKMSQYRPKEFEDYERKVYQKKASDLELKKKILKSIYGDPQDGDIGEDQDVRQQEQQPNKKRGKKRRRPKRLQQVASTASFKVMPLNDNIFVEEVEPNTNEVEEKKSGEEIEKKEPQKQQPQEINKGQKRKRRGNKRPGGDGKGRTDKKAADSAHIQRLKAYGMSNREIKRVKTTM